MTDASARALSGLALVAALTSCSLVVEPTQHVRPPGPAQGEVCSTDEDCEDGLLCERRACAPCWASQQVVGQALPDAPSSVSVLVTEERLHAAASAGGEAWLLSADITDGTLSEAAFVSINAQLGLLQVNAVALARAPRWRSDPSEIEATLPVLAAVGSDEVGPALFVGQLEPALSGDVVALGSGADPIGPLALVPSVTAGEHTTAPTRPLVWALWRQRTGDGPELRGYLASGARFLAPFSEGVVDGDFFMREGTEGLVVFGAPDAETIGSVVPDAGLSSFRVLPTPARQGPASVAALGEHRFVLGYTDGSRVHVAEYDCLQGCGTAQLSARLRHFERMVSPDLVFSPAGPVLGYRHLEEGREPTVELAVLRREHGLRQGWVAGSGFSATMLAAPSELPTLRLAAPRETALGTWPMGAAWARSSDGAGWSVEVSLFRACGTRPEDFPPTPP
ncbi:MAG: hypothetical protein AB8I08_22585 [Sandaracinaceae bacterium]